MIRFAKLNVKGIPISFAVGNILWPSIGRGTWVEVPKHISPAATYDFMTGSWTEEADDQMATPSQNAFNIWQAANVINDACTVLLTHSAETVPVSVLMRTIDTLNESSKIAELAISNIPANRLIGLLEAHMLVVPENPAAALYQVKQVGSTVIQEYIQNVWPLFEGATHDLQINYEAGVPISIEDHPEKQIEMIRLTGFLERLGNLQVALEPFVET